MKILCWSVILLNPKALTTSMAATVGSVDAIYNFSAADFLVDPSRPYVYASSGASLKVINSTTLAVERSVPLPASSYGMAMSSDGNRLYIAGGAAQSIFVLDCNTWSLLPSLSIGNSPKDLAMGLNNRLFVLGTQLSQIDATTGVSTGPNAPVFAYGGALRISPDRRTLFYANFGLSPGSLYKLDVSSTIPALMWKNGTNIGENGQQLALSHDGSMVAYVCGYGYQGYRIPNFRTSDMSLSGVFPTGAYPNCMAYSPDDKYVYALHTIYPSAVDIYDASSYAKIGQFPIVDRAHVMTTDQTGQHLFIAFSGIYYGHREVRAYNTGRTVKINQPPVALCQNVTKSADSDCQAVVSPADIDNGSYDPDGDPFTLALSPPGPYPLGVNNVTFTVTDSHGAFASSEAMITVRDTTPPQVGNIVSSLNVLWPPNHRLVPVSVLVSATDTCDPSPTARIVRVTSNEPLGNSGFDWKTTGPLSVELRAERSGNRDRIYTIFVDVTDSSGNKTETSTTILVPKSYSASHDQIR